MSGNSDEIYLRASPSKRPTVPEDWPNLLGEYGWNYNVLRIMDRNNELTALLEMEFNPLTKISDDIWEFPTDSAYGHEKLIFVREKGGCATQVRIGELVFPKRSGCADSKRHSEIGQ